MTTRLTYSPEAMIRRMQISSRLLFAFVEGRKDRYFYARICAQAVAPRHAGYEVMTAEELPVKEPGKRGLLEWFQFLTQHNALCSTFKDKKTVVAFFADKDIDDLSETQVSSPHFFYTDFYNIENHLIAEGDLAEGIAALAGLDPVFVRATLGPTTQWRMQAAEAWREWTVLCVFTRVHGLNCPVNYSRVSQVHPDPYGALDHAARDAHLSTIRNAAQHPPDEFDQRLAATRTTVDQLYQAGHSDRVFKGNWYIEFVFAHVNRVAGQIPHNPERLRSGLFQQLAPTVPLNAGWAGSLVINVSALLDCAA